MRLLLILAFVFGFQNLSSQNDIPEISVEFEKMEKVEVMKRIETISGYKFFYLKEWIVNELITGNFKKVKLTEVLNYVFKGTTINFFITADKRIILTNNSIIYDTLPEKVLTERKKDSAQITNKQPVLYKEDISDKKDKLATVRLGKEQKHVPNEKFKLSGFVNFFNTGLPVPNAVVSVLGKNINTLTNVDGYYEIEIDPGENIVTINSLEIEDFKQRIIIYNSETFNFRVKEKTELLEEVIVESDKFENITEVLPSITKIDVDEVKEIPQVLGERDILKVATTLPGIKTAGEGSSGYYVRGGNFDQNLILLDDAVLYNPFHFFGIFSALNPFTSGDVTIFKGNMPAEYGGRLSSVFDIKTKKTNKQKVSGEGAIGPVTGNLSFEIPLTENKSGIIIGARGTYSDWILRSLDNEFLKKSKASFYDIVAKYSNEVNENNSIEVSGYFSNDEFSITSDSLYNYSNRLLSINWKHKFSEKNTTSTILSNSQYKYNIGYEGNSIANFDFAYKINETNLKIQNVYNYNDNHTFNFGFSSKFYDVSPGILKPKANSIIEEQDVPKEKALESGVFISDKYKLNEKLLFDFGLRYSFYVSLGKALKRVYQEGMPKNELTVVDTLNYGRNEIIKTFGGPEVRFSARYFLNPYLSVKASYNNSYQFIHALSENTTASPTDIWKLSSLNIKPQQAQQIALGIYRNSENKMYELSIEGYFKRLNNILDYKVGANLLLNEAIETKVIQGRGKAYGIEFLIKKNTGKFNGWLSYSYARSLIKLDSKFNEEKVNNGAFFRSNFDKPHDLSLITNYKFTNRYSISANFIYQTGRPITFPVGKYIFNGAEYVSYSRRNEFRIPDYYRLDIGLNIEGNHKLKKLAHGFWNISVYNVLGRNNPYSVYFLTEGGEVKAYKNSIFSIPVPTITYNFKF